MNSSSALRQSSRRTAADDVFKQLHNDIVSLQILPGTKLSESDIAKKSDVSHQPVREAFARLSNLGLLTIRPHKATLVRKISNKEILNARFVRTAIEIEVARKACESATRADFRKFDLNLRAQAEATLKNDARAFHALDYAFHRLICDAAEAEFAFSAIAENKSQIDRVSMLTLAESDQMLELLEDHSGMVDALKRRNVSEMIDLTRLHLCRLDSMLKNARVEHSDYFED